MTLNTHYTGNYAMAAVFSAVALAWSLEQWFSAEGHLREFVPECLSLPRDFCGVTGWFGRKCYWHLEPWVLLNILQCTGHPLFSPKESVIWSKVSVVPLRNFGVWAQERLPRGRDIRTQNWRGSRSQWREEGSRPARGVNAGDQWGGC